jgi:hypothetical protein
VVTVITYKLRPTDPVIPQRVLIPNANNRTGSQMPQMLYLELQRRMKYSAADRPFIRIATKKTTAGPSLSPCK